MSDEKRETISDVLVDFRQYVSNTKIPPEVAETIVCYLDRIKAAANREKAETEADALAVGGIVEAARHKPVDNAMMRKAILAIKDINDRRHHDADGYEINDIINDMLSEPEPTAEKSSAVGNAAAMREALEKIAHYCDDKNGMDDPYCADGHILSDIARAALVAPPRNCDVGTAEEQASRMRQFCTKQKRNGIINCGYCPIKHEYQRDCTLSWAQMHYEAQEGAVE